MKNLFFALALIFGLSSFSTATNIETVDNSFVNENVYTQNMEADLLGICHIRIYDSEDNLVYEVFLPANTPEACEQMLINTLKSFD